MVYPANPVLLNAIKKEKIEQFLRQAEIDRLVCQSEPKMRNRLFLPGRQRRERLGHQLIALGERLERLGTKPSA